MKVPTIVLKVVKAELDWINARIGKIIAAESTVPKVMMPKILR
mgnify:CR=1 FL=1